MKTLFKSPVFAALVALFLSISLSGCFDEGSKTASQGGGVSSSVFDSGKVKLVLKPGARFVYMHFSNRASAEKQREALDRAFSESEISGYKSKISGGGSEILLFVSVERIKDEFSVNIDSSNLLDIDIQSLNGRVAIWVPSTGGEVRYETG